MPSSSNMKRNFLEISDDEWENHTFKPSRVLGTSNPPPPIENFAYTSAKASNSNQSSDDSVEITGSYQVNHQVNHPVNREENLEDDDYDEGVKNVSKQASRGRRFIVDDDDSDDDFVVEGDNGLVDVVQVNSSDEGEDSDKDSIFDDDEMEEDDVIGKALQKCAKISAVLRKELYGSSVTTCDRYAEVDASSVRIVNQDDVLAACAEEDSDFQPLLKPYQLVGVNFLLLHYRQKIGGAILADEMGLGKTIQAITYLTLLNHLEDDPGPHLVVCPASLLENWEREFKKWCPSFSVLQYHGTARSTYSRELSSLAKSGRPPPYNVILVCYSLFERHSGQQKDDRKILKRWKWSCVLMDEAHALKDKNSYRWKNLMSVGRNAKQRLMLTGTPLQNDLHELWSLLELMMPDIFETGDVDLKKLLTSEDRDLISRMKSILGPFILRRLKSDVMGQLSPKTQQVEYVEMTKQQQDAYTEAIEEYRTASQARLKLSGDKSALGILPKKQISNYFLQFRKIANHPLLVRRIYTDADAIRIAKILHSRGVFGFECNSERAVKEVKSYNDFKIHRQLLCNGISDIKGVLSNEHLFSSAKCETLKKLLPRLHKNGHRVLIFSQWTSMLDILEWALDVIGLNYRRLDGGTEVTARQNIVDTFNKNTSIFACLLSTRAGGQGLNLVGADTVIIHDMDFNPQVDRQAEDRCHRIGQTKPVTVYRLVTKDSVDENVYEIAKRKLVLDAAVLETGVEVENEGGSADKTMGEILSSLLLG